MKRYLRLFGLAATLTLLHTGVATATHKNWVLKDSGSECTFAVPMASDNLYNYELFNPESFARSAYCPVALAARWGSTGGTFGAFAPPLWTEALEAIVYTTSGWSGQPHSCQAQMQASNGSLYFSGTANGVGSGHERVVLAAQEPIPSLLSRWVAYGGPSDLEANEGIVMKGLSFFCTVPVLGGITGYKVRVCQTQTECRFAAPDVESQTGGAGSEASSSTFNWIQVSGIECAPDDRSQVIYNNDGIVNTGATGSRYVLCPLTPPSSDTVDVSRVVQHTRIYYSGGSTASNCVDQRTCPVCALHWHKRLGNDWSGSFGSSPGIQMHPTFGLYEGQLQIVGQEIGLYVGCDLPPQVTLRGITARLSVSPIVSGT